MQEEKQSEIQIELKEQALSSGGLKTLSFIFN